jgi:hypothetical protein
MEVKLKAFRILLSMMIIGIVVYTGIVGYNHGWNLFPVFFGDIAAMTWPGQFNFDFTCFLVFSAIWLAWRNNFTPGAIVLGAFGLVGGTMLLAPYLLFVSFQAKGDMKEILIGREGAAK